MTENKRFNSLWEYEGGTGDIAIYNDEKYYWIMEKGYPQSKAIHDVIDLLNELHEDYDKLFKFVVVMNRQINNSILISDQFKEGWNHVLKKVVGELE